MFRFLDVQIVLALRDFASNDIRRPASASELRSSCSIAGVRVLDEFTPSWRPTIHVTLFKICVPTFIRWQLASSFLLQTACALHQYHTIHL